ncbi:MAG TPA: molybdenum cofactor guanylyltransferase [Chthoniobacterales bacterium]|jgi:molybdopterin-guanine dinucleotide biosynthesis protein A
MVDATGFIVAGGKSSRMGRDKAWLEIGGEPMIQRIVRAFLPVTTHLAIIANSPEYAELGLPVYADTHIGIGPIEAIRTALSNCRTEYSLLAACDMPFITSDLLSFLIVRQSGYDAVVPMDAEGKIEPLCAAYSIRALHAVTELIGAGQRKPSLIYELVKTRFVPFSEFADLPGSNMFFRNVNTESDYLEALAVAV